MEGEDYENKKDNLQSASGMPGISWYILWQSKCICRSETGIVGNGDSAETGKRLCRTEYVLKNRSFLPKTFGNVRFFCTLVA